jgi:hypothetical protein
MKSLNEKIECYFTPEAARAIDELQAVGLDRDLAVSVLETLWTEEAIYDLEGESHGQRTRNKA